MPQRLKNFARRNLPWLIAFALIWFGVRAWQQRDMASGPLPVTTLPALDGQIIRLDALPRPYLIHFTASWCPICRLQHETMRALSQEYTVIQIITQSGDRRQALAFARQHGMKLPLTVNDPDGRLLALFGSRAVPADFFVGRNGTIVLHEMGYTSGIGYRLRLWWAGL